MQDGSFDQIYQDYFDSVYRYALSLSGNPQTAEEIAQETFFRAMRTLDSINDTFILRPGSENVNFSENRRFSLISSDFGRDAV